MRAREAKLANQGEGVARRPVFDDLAVGEAADDDPPQAHRAPAVRSGERPARHHTVTLGHLLVDLETEVRDSSR